MEKSTRSSTLSMALLTCTADTHKEIKIDHSWVSKCVAYAPVNPFSILFSEMYHRTGL